MTRLLKSAEAAEMLAISERTLWSLTNANEIPHIRIGKSVRYSVADLEAWIESKRESPIPVQSSPPKFGSRS